MPFAPHFELPNRVCGMIGLPETTIGRMGQDLNPAGKKSAE